MKLPKIEMLQTTDIIQYLGYLKNPDFQEIGANIKPGVFERDPDSKDYQDRLIYTREFRKFIYNPAVMNVILSNRELKLSFFRTFGYEGSIDFTIYPNCWLRDLPCIDIGKDTYLADGILLGTNQVSTDQKVLRVGKIRIGERCVFDQDCKLGYNSTIGNDCIIGIQTAIGLKTRMGNNVKIGESSRIRHGNRFGNNVVLGSECQVGNFCIFDEGVELEEFTQVPSFSHVTHEDIYSRKQVRKAA